MLVSVMNIIYLIGTLVAAVVLDLELYLRRTNAAQEELRRLVEAFADCSAKGFQV